MKTAGIRILDKNKRVVSVKLQDILEEVHHGELFHWSILSFEGSGHLKDGKSIPVFRKEIRESERGLLVKWDELIALASTFWEVEDMLIIGCKDPTLISQYEEEKDMYDTCDIVINMFDSCYWEVFSKDKAFILRLATKFKDIKFLNDYPRMG